MADDRHFVPGSYFRICDLSGFKIRAERTRKKWNEFIVREQSWEPRHPQDLVRGVRDDQNVPDPRPRQQDLFINQSPNYTGEFEVYGDLPSGPGPSFLVQNNQGPAYNTGLNSDYENPSGTAEMQAINGTVPQVRPENYPGPNQAGEE